MTGVSTNNYCGDLPLIAFLLSHVLSSVDMIFITSEQGSTIFWPDAIVKIRELFFFLPISSLGSITFSFPPSSDHHRHQSALSTMDARPKGPILATG